MIFSHFKAIEKSVQSGLFKFVAHLDYVCKMGTEFYSNKNFIEEKNAVLKELVETSTGTEISTKGLRKIGDFYPENWFLEKIKELNIPIVISDDAHRVDELGLDFEKAEAKLKELNITNRIKMR